jgi:hypothetical protein
MQLVNLGFEVCSVTSVGSARCRPAAKGVFDF